MMKRRNLRQEIDLARIICRRSLVVPGSIIDALPLDYFVREVFIDQFHVIWLHRDVSKQP